MHYEKCKNGSEAARCGHNSRTCGNHSNKNIDPDKTKYNRNLTTLYAADGRSDMERFKDRLNQLTYRKQKNNIRMCEIVITAPKNIKGNKDMAKFFLTAHKALQSLTGGPDNEVSAWCHLDEDLQHGRPHLHYCFVPGIEVNGVMRLSASKLIDREFLKNLHPTMQAAIDKAFGHHEYLVVADDPAERQQTSDTIAAYKAKRAKLDELKANIKEQESILTDLQSFISNRQETLQELNESIKDKIDQCKALNSRIDELTDIDQDLQVADIVREDYPEYYEDLINYINGIEEPALDDQEDPEL